MEIAEICIASIVDGMQVLHDFETPFVTANCPYILS